jgi:CRISPR/Cas system CSM-associated protein Csm4 (group 5 of RAMP superfamily)
MSVLTSDGLFDAMVSHFKSEYPDNLNLKSKNRAKIPDFPSCDGIYRFPNPFVKEVNELDKHTYIIAIIFNAI